MTRRTSILTAALGMAIAAGCYTGPNADLSPPTPGPGSSTDGTQPRPGDGVKADGDDAGLAATGLPCDVAKVLAASCTGCHARTPRLGAPNALVTYEDLAAPSPSDPSRSNAAVSVERMKAAKRPMPPDGTLDASDVAVVASWVAAGLPRGACGGKPDGPGASDAGPAPDGGKTSTEASAPVTSVCSSGTTWAAGSPADEFMHPGKACIACHSQSGGPPYTMAGTIYPTLHEPDDCNGSGTGNPSVLIIDATGKSHTIPVDAAGNFMRVTSVPLPYRAMIVDGSKVREMKTPQTDGDCNGCHTELGNRAPGRVMAP